MSANSSLFVKAPQDTHFTWSQSSCKVAFNNTDSGFGVASKFAATETDFRRQVRGSYAPRFARSSYSPVSTALFPVIYRIDWSRLVQRGDEVEHWHGLTCHLTAPASLQKVLMYTGSICWGTLTAAIESNFWFARIRREKSALFGGALCLEIEP